MTNAREPSLIGIEDRPVDGVSTSKFIGAWSDLCRGASLWRIWLSLAWFDLRSTYKRSIFGLFWIALAFAMFVFVKIVIFGAILEHSNATYYSAYLILGFFIWRFMSLAVNSAPNVFSASSAWIQNDPLPISLFVYRMVSREVINAIMTAAVVIGGLAYLGISPKPYAFLSFVAALVLVLNVLWVKILLGIISTRYRDFGHLIQAVMGFMFFLTPIFWMPDQVGDLMTVLWWNPFFHYLEIFRNPILDDVVSVSSWVFVGILTLVGWIAAFGMFAAFRRRIVFWL